MLIGFQCFLKIMTGSKRQKQPSNQLVNKYFQALSNAGAKAPVEVLGT